MASSKRVGKLVVVGVGLIGGSFALALRAAGAVGEVVGIGRTRSNLDDARQRGMVDRACTLDSDWLEELREADFVLFATPVAQLPDLFAACARCIGPTTVLSDAGSTKQDVIAAARSRLGSTLPQFVPAHPIAGTEHTGAKAAFATLFRERNVVLTPTAETDREAVRQVRELWELTGATVRELDPAQHDRVFAAVSHLPHVLAFALVDELARRPDAQAFFAYAASGFRDFTRIAASSPEMWRDIALANREALLAELATFRSELDAIARLIEAGDGAALHAIFSRGSAARRAWGESRRSDVPDDGPREP
ncbi:MAG TPA: prephenate dehydrogenase/arogenate dehydrogenase family protein [Casimicrobiaceae bacterium]|nr:prephenate dehydrogenase/arogenate dehydrogenase family protein [Casimicrobiaceae bacterium]